PVGHACTTPLSSELCELLDTSVRPLSGSAHTAIALTAHRNTSSTRGLIAVTVTLERSAFGVMWSRTTWPKPLPISAPALMTFRPWVHFAVTVFDGVASRALCTRIRFRPGTEAEAGAISATPAAITTVATDATSAKRALRRTLGARSAYSCTSDI